MADPPASADDVDLSADDRAHIDGMYLRLASSDLYELLGVARSADRRAIRDAYFTLSQRFHPDAYFGRKLGPWKQRIEEVFRELTRAYDVLANKNRRAEYDATLPAADPDATRVNAPANPFPEMSPARAAEAAAAAQNATTAPQRPTTAAHALRAGAEVSAAANAVGAPVNAFATTAAAVARSVPAQPSTPSADRSGPVPTMPAEDPSLRPQLPMQRAGETSRRLAVPPAPPPPGQPAPPMPSVHIDHEAARRAAREALARKLAGGRAPSGTMPTVRAGVTPPQSPAAPRPAMPARDPSEGPLSTPLDSLASFRTDRVEAERRARIQQLVRKAEEATAQKDYTAAANALGMAASLDPGNAAMKARADEACMKMAETQVDKNVEQARTAERGGSWELAALFWQRASTGRPKDASLLERAAQALIRANKDLSRAAELARKATQLSPQRVDAHTTLAQVFLAGGMRASALAALESASKLDPNSPVVKDLMAKAKG